MKCLYCQKRVLAFRFLGGGDVFCSDEHKELYRKAMAESAIDRILKMEARPKPKKAEAKQSVTAEQAPQQDRKEVHPAPALAIQLDEASPPEMAGFRMPVIEPMAFLVAAQVFPALQPASVQVSPEMGAIRLASRTEWCWTLAGNTNQDGDEIDGRPIPALADPVVLGLGCNARPPIPLLASTTLSFADGAAPEGAGTSKAAFPARLAAGKPTIANVLTIWDASVAPLPDAETAPCGKPELQAAPAVAWPEVVLDRFVSPWTAQPTRPVWRASLDGSSLSDPMLEVTHRAASHPGLLNWPSAPVERLAVPNATDARSLLAAVTHRPAPEPSRATADLRLPVNFSMPACPMAPPSTLLWDPSGPSRPVSAVLPERAQEMIGWTAWPEVGSLVTPPLWAASPVCGLGLPSVSAVTGLAGFVRGSEGAGASSSLSVTASTDELTFPCAVLSSITGLSAFDAMRGTPAQLPLSSLAYGKVTHPRPDIRRPGPSVRYRFEPVGVRACRLPVRLESTACVHPRSSPGQRAEPIELARSGDSAQVIRPALDSGAQVFDLLCRSTFAKGWTPQGPQVDAPRSVEQEWTSNGQWPACTLAERRPAAFNAAPLDRAARGPVARRRCGSLAFHALAGPDEVGSGREHCPPAMVAVEATVHRPAVAPWGLELANIAHTAAIWGQLQDRRALCAAVPGRRNEAHLRLLPHEHLCRKATLPLAQVQLPSRIALTAAFQARADKASRVAVCLAERLVPLRGPSAPPSGTLSGALAGAAPGAETGPATGALTGIASGASWQSWRSSRAYSQLGWIVLEPAPETPVRKRSFPASKPKMKRPQPSVPSRPLAFAHPLAALDEEAFASNVAALGAASQALPTPVENCAAGLGETLAPRR